MTHLTIITRHLPTRQRLFAAHTRSLDAQTSTDFEQIILRGMKSMEQAQTRLHYVDVNSKYVWVLDDDDLAHPYAVEAIARNAKGDANVFRFSHGANVLPPNNVYPSEGLIGVSALVVSRDCWNATRHKFGARYAGDYDWIHHVLSNYHYARHDIVLGRISAANRGAGDE